MRSFRWMQLGLLVASCMMTSVGAIAAPAGALPSGMPPRMLVGLFEQWGETWMRSSGVRWDARYGYFTKGWSNNWGWGSHDGSMATSYFNEANAAGFIPAVQFYQMNGEAGGGEAQFLNKVQTASTMATYFGDFKLLMQRARDYGKPVIVMLEADGFGFLQQQTNSNPNTYAAIAASKLPELAGLPNTVAGWGLAFLQLKKSVGANNVVLGVHVSSWASNQEIAYHSISIPLQPEVDKVYNFLAPLGLASNVTGLTYDFLVGDPLDRDADYYKVTQGADRWWSTSDSASINSKSFNRYAEWLRLWNIKSRKRWLLWQIPLGNSNHLNVNNDGGSRQGYKDNRAEYFFGSGSRAHLEKFAESGVFGLLFGAGATGQSSFQNDVYTDGQLFMKSRVGAFVKAGGLPLDGGSATPTPTPTPTPSAVDYDFETGLQGWQSNGAPVAAVGTTTSRRYAGSRAMAVRINGSGKAAVKVLNPAAKAGQTVTAYVYLPPDARISGVTPFVQQNASGGNVWTGNYQPASALKFGAWNKVSVTVPSNASLLSSMGIEFTTNGTYSGSVCIDNVSF